jgi:predicted molibdopterin-dependent oxidoreductase YjgC
MADNANFLLQPAPGTDAELLRGIQAGITSLGLNNNSAFPDERSVPSTEELVKISQATGIQPEMMLEVARQVALAQRPVFVYGKGLVQNGSKPAFSELRNLAELVGKAPLVNIKGKANSLAAYAYGLNRRFDTGNSKAVYLALGDDYPTTRLMKRLEHAGFVAVQASFVSELVERADVVLPVETWAEQEGHYLNLEGRLQVAHRALSAPDQVRSNLSVLRSLAEHMDVRINDQWKEEILNFRSITGN